MSFDKKAYNKSYGEKYRQKNKEKLAEYQRSYYKKRNTTNYSLYGRNWYQRNKESNLERGRKWQRNNRKRAVEIVLKSRAKHIDKFKKYSYGYYASPKGKYANCKIRHKRFSGKIINRDEFVTLVQLPCNYCGEYEYPRGADRINNLLGYVKENLVSCCKLCNYMKRAETKEKFLSHIQKIYNYQRKIT